MEEGAVAMAAAGAPKVGPLSIGRMGAGLLSSSGANVDALTGGFRPGAGLSESGSMGIMVRNSPLNTTLYFLTSLPEAWSTSVRSRNSSPLTVEPPKLLSFSSVKERRSVFSSNWMSLCNKGRAVQRNTHPHTQREQTPEQR